MKANILQKRSVRQKIILLGALLIIFLFFTLQNASFASYENIMTITLATCINGILSLGVTFVILTGGIDLSIGTVMTFSGIISGIIFNKTNLPIGVCIIIGLLSGAFCGLINGFAVTKMHLPPFIATMCMMMITKGLNLIIPGIKPVYFTEAKNYQKIATGDFLGIPGFYNAIFIYFLCACLAAFIYHRTIIGRYAKSIGSNENATRLSGVRTDRWKIAVYIICGLFSAIAGLVMSSRLNSAQPQLGAGYETEAIAATVIGGTSMSGGLASIWGSVIGAFIVSTLTNGLRSMAVATEWQTVLIGIVLALALFIDQLQNKKAQG
ncbi:MAG TPA: ABC transporter permease [Clostridiaceae bacterium]|nr:ABC transporter permease [Clostridiaceae bacterium]